MSSTYFATDGSYGDSTGFLVVPTGSWTDEMWEIVEMSGDNRRMELAKHFNVGVHTVVKGLCEMCELTPEEFDESVGEPE